MTRISPRTYTLVLASVLVFAAYRLLVLTPPLHEERFVRTPPLWVALPVGAAIGFLSGVVGVGGGIFLSPLLILMRWADAKRTAAVSAAFIWINSAAGLFGHLHRDAIDWHALFLFAGVAFAGALVGSSLGSNPSLMT